MQKDLNLYGDVLVKTTGKHGADIASQRMDDLDVEALHHALTIRDGKGTAIDLGCGLGIQGLRFASYGIRTILIDWLPAEMTVLRADGIDRLMPLSHIMKDAKSLVDSDMPDNISICYSQRFIHYLAFDDAVKLLRLMRGRMIDGAKLFISASGLHSELGNGYSAQDLPLEKRFAPLCQEMAEKHDIREPVCLYTTADLESLCVLTCFRAERVFTSAFGNVKGIFTAA